MPTFVSVFTPDTKYTFSVDQIVLVTQSRKSTDGEVLLQLQDNITFRISYEEYRDHVKPVLKHHALEGQDIQ